MASQLVVVDASMRRAVVKTQPGTHLSDVLVEACKKLGCSPDNFGLKHNNKTIDLSRTIRLSSLPTGAKLTLVQASRSPSVVSVALQLPASGQAPSQRLLDKFPSDTSIWQILRRFESGAAGGTSTSNLNLTQRGVANMDNSASSGSGRLYYSMPVVNFPMGRELSTFVDLQKTLGQVGFSGGSCLLRLSYRTTGQPLEEAMTEISQYFEAAESTTASDSHGAHAGAVNDLQSAPGVDTSVLPEDDAKSPALDDDVPMTPAPTLGTGPMTTTEAPNEQSTEMDISSSNPPVDEGLQPTGSTPTSGPVIFAPPSSSVPAAVADLTFNEEDYQPTVVHAQQHQARLNNESRNKRLQSDKEIEEQQKAVAAMLEAVKQITVRFRFPDNSSANQQYGQEATVSDLYELCRQMLSRPKDEEFLLRCPSTKGQLQHVPETKKRLIKDLGWQSRMLVTVSWGENVSRSGPSLKPEYIAQAKQLQVQLASNQESSESTPVAAVTRPVPEKKGGSSADKESKLKSFLRLGKK